MLLLPLGLYEERVAQVVIMEMKRRFVISIPIGFDYLPV